MYFSIATALLLALLMASTRVASTPIQGDIITPPRPSKPEDYMMPKQCEDEGKSFCFERGEDYPQDKVDNLLNNLKLQPGDTYDTPGIKSGIEYDEPDCQYNSIMSPIYYIIDTTDTVRVVLQNPDRFEQIYITEWCLNEGRITSGTSHLSSRIVEDYYFECVTIKMNHEFLVLGKDDDTKMERVQAKDGIPVCCKCQYRA